MYRYDIISGLVFALIAIYALITASSFPQDHVMGIGPNYFPTLLSIGLLLFSLILIGRGVLKRSKGKIEGFSLKEEGTKRLFLSVIVAIAYTLVLPFLGFTLSTFFVIAVYMKLLGIRSVRLLGSVPLLVVIAVYLLFEKFLSIALPSGFLKGLF